MKAPRELKLELLRTGPADNQLISQTTEYLALGGDAEPKGIRLPWKHRQLQDRLEHLRYTFGVDGAAEALRTATLDELGEQIAELLAEVPGLPINLGPADTGAPLAHVRLVLAGNELATIPWELVQVPPGVGGSGTRLLLQGRIPVAMTREVRGSSRRSLAWSRTPRVLFAAATSADFPPNLIEAHLLALRRALAPWRWGSWLYPEQGPDPAVDLLTDASIEEIRERCQAREYTHIHILAHGDAIPGQDGQVGLRLHRRGKPEERQVIDAATLALALRPLGTTDIRDPVMVTLASCDSARQTFPTSRTGSLVHELHRHGVPWVIGAQFPLTTTGSVILVDELYKRILGGEDPRLAIHHVRCRLATTAACRNDWAAVVAYASLPRDFEQQVTELRRRFDNARRSGAYTRIDRLIVANTDVANVPEGFRVLRRADAGRGGDGARFLRELDGARQFLDAALERNILEQRNNGAPRAETTALAADTWAARGALRKRQAEITWLADPRSTEKVESAWIAMLEEAHEAYGKGARLGSWDAHWNLGQYIVLGSVLAGLKNAPPTALAWKTQEAPDWQARMNAVLQHLWEVRTDPVERSWLLSTKVDLVIVGAIEEDAAEVVREMIKLGGGRECKATWPTWRQVHRFLNWWKTDADTTRRARKAEIVLAPYANAYIARLDPAKDAVTPA